MRRYLTLRNHLLVGWIFAGALATSLDAAPATLWKHDFGSVKPGPVFDGGVAVADPIAPGGNSLQLTFAKAGALPAIATTNGVILAGTGTIRVWVRGQDLNDVANGLQLTVSLANQTPGAAGYGAAGVVYGVRANEKAYRLLPIEFEVGDEPAPYTVTITAVWQKQIGDRKPTVWISKLELEGHDASTPYISGLRRRRFMVAPGRDVQIAVTMVNPTPTVFHGKLRTEDLFGLTGHRFALTTAVALAAGERRVLDLSWKASRLEGGHEFAFVLLDGNNQELDRDRIGLGITNDGRQLHLPTYDFERGTIATASSSYVYPASYTQSRNTVGRELRDRNNRSGRLEFFEWSWGDVGGFVPPEDPYLGNFEHQWWLSLKQYKDEIALNKAAGVQPVSYIFSCPMGQAAYDLYQQHPDWFIYGPDGSGPGGNMETQARYARRGEFEFVQAERYSMVAGIDPTNPEVRRFVAEQIIKAAKAMGFEGCRWDTGWMNIAPRWYRLDGAEIAPTWPVADRLSAESLKAVKDLVAKELPEYTWGYNGCDFDGNKDTPLTLAEKCRGGGWALDEVPAYYHTKTSPYYHWDAYSKVMVEMGDRIRRLGGIYNPFTFDRQYNPATQSEMDYLYGSIFRILAGGRGESFYKNNSALVGDLPLLAFRYNDLYSGSNLKQQPESQTRLAVAAPATLWWKEYVFASQSPAGAEQAIVHLVNSPIVADIGENPASKVRPPVLDATVSCQAVAGRLPKKAWLVTAEPVTPDAEPQVQAVPLKLIAKNGAVSVTVPAVLYLKTVVFEQ